MKTIKTLDEVKLYIQGLIEDGLIFHPDEAFANYVDLKTGTPTY
ncbi:hypothetical protein [Litoribacter populi]|nr:hypothetical protein [Litoribacter populi]